MTANSLILGNWNALCDSCGRRFKASELQKRWDGLMVCREDFEQRHHSDFLRVQKEKIAVDWVRPYPAQDTFVGYCTTEGRSSIADLAVADCAIADSEYTYVPPVVSRDTLPPFCTIGSAQPLADIGAADCATIGF